MKKLNKVIESYKDSKGAKKMMFYCAEDAFKTLGKDNKIINNIYNSDIYSWQVIQVQNPEDIFLIFLNDISGIVFILYYNDESKIDINKSVLTEAIFRIMKDMQYPLELISLYLNQPWTINVSSWYSYEHMEAISDMLTKFKEEFISNINRELLIQRKISFILNNRHVDNWNGYYEYRRACKIMEDKIKKCYKEQ